MKNPTTFSICICTYKRPELLRLLIADIAAQSLLPDQLIIVDGDPASGEVKALLENSNIFKAIVYLPSNHPNLAYQRYLGWRIAQENQADYLLYIDDDLRIHKTVALSRLREPMQQDRMVVGVSADTSKGPTGALEDQPVLINSHHQARNIRKFIDLFGSGRSIPPGGLTPSGHRKFPMVLSNGFTEVQWLQGRVMFYRMSAVSKDCFSDDLFALDHIRCDLGEDTFLSRRIGVGKRLLLGFGLGFDHPNADLPKCYPVEARKFAYARAYSRRFLNDHYRVNQPPQFRDRIALVKSYLGNTLLGWWQAFSDRQEYQIAYARGYTQGALRGIFQKPTARNLTPEIDWWGDAEKALAQTVIIR